MTSAMPAQAVADDIPGIQRLEAAIATLRAIYKPGSPKAEAAGLQIVIGFDDALQFGRDAGLTSLEPAVRAALERPAQP